MEFRQKRSPRIAAWTRGTAETVHQGGEGRCIELTKGPQGGCDCVHHKNGRMRVIATRTHFLKAIVWRSDAQQPTLLDDSPSSSSLTYSVFLFDF